MSYIVLKLEGILSRRQFLLKLKGSYEYLVMMHHWFKKKMVTYFVCIKNILSTKKSVTVLHVCVYCNQFMHIIY